MEFAACDTQTSVSPEANRVPAWFLYVPWAHTKLFTSLNELKHQRPPLLTLIITKTQHGTVLQINFQVCAFALTLLVWTLNTSL